jgi:hypothetical protein
MDCQAAEVTDDEESIVAPQTSQQSFNKKHLKSLQHLMEWISNTIMQTMEGLKANCFQKVLKKKDKPLASVA